MHLVELFLPVEDPTGASLAPRIEELVATLAERFGGATAFLRAPAEGLWKQGGTLERDRIVVVEVMVDALDEAWWHALRTELEARFEQDEILIRATRTTRL